MTWKALGRHRWVTGALITESENVDTGERRFTATIRGYRGFRIYQGELAPSTASDVMEKVIALRDQIDDGDEVVFESGSAD